MKNILFLVAFIAILTPFSSCKKSSGPGGGSGSNGTLVRIQQGVSASDDSVYLIRYDTKNRISVLLDSINMDSLSAVYNSANQVTAIEEASPYSDDNLSATYNGSGQLTEIDYSLFGELDKYVFEYTGSMPSKATFSTNSGSGPLKVYRIYTYTATGSNITDIKENDANMTLLGERKITFGSEPNPFKTLALFNWGNRLGTDDIITLETIFNANLPSTTTWLGDSNNVFYTTTLTATNNSNNNPTKLIATEKFPDGSIQNLFTWSFTYK
ncbi:MAG TPA: hypothetical protein VNU70_06580 [Puia sp.]|jgi:hypothetical protein|nr:hypothetical protein [Puia sp.]